jgi:hypothetical protein
MNTNFEAPHYEGSSSLKMNGILKILTLMKNILKQGLLCYSELFMSAGDRNYFATVFY